MELPQSTLDALTLAGDSVHVPDALFPNFLEVAFRGVINSSDRNAIEGVKGLSKKDHTTVKEAYSGLVSMVIEAAKQDKDTESLSSLLEDCKFPPERIKQVLDVYQKNKAALQILLGSVGTTPAHIVDVDWRLDYYVKNNHLERVNEAVYLINLKTEVPGKTELQEVQFSCSQEQLQDLVGKLKDACKCLERVSQS
ncbi:COMM domain-containing protein 3-like [Saccostrea echinata]|uniref:COMM domain-containing protein 3-like n=1 Tax=Saccostrea echinata TaxID=191078 RepID=UPI002A803170|nr:COMM domain-containing protein 3-like [Saccostrea echinata]